MKNLFTAILMAAMFAFAGTAFAAGPPPVAAPAIPADTDPTPDAPAVPATGATAPTTVPSGNPDIAGEAQGDPPVYVIEKLFDL